MGFIATSGEVATRFLLIPGMHRSNSEASFPSQMSIFSWWSIFKQRKGVEHRASTKEKKTLSRRICVQEVLGSFFESSRRTLELNLSSQIPTDELFLGAKPWVCKVWRSAMKLHRCQSALQISQLLWHPSSHHQVFHKFSVYCALVLRLLGNF